MKYIYFFLMWLSVIGNGINALSQGNDTNFLLSAILMAIIVFHTRAEEKFE